MMQRFFENSVKPYTILINSKKEKNDPPPQFTVTINKSTVNKGFVEFAAELTKNPVPGLNFIIADISTLEISINPGKLLSPATDLKFRNAISLVNLYSLSTKESEEVIKVYNQYLQENGLSSSYLAKQQQASFQFRPSGSTVY